MIYPISTIFSPSRKNTVVSDCGHEWRPRDLPSFKEELEALLFNINEACIFRGHRKNEWIIDSTFARSLKKEQKIPLTQRYPEDQINEVIHQHSTAAKWIAKVRKIALSPNLQSYSSQGIDPLFEFHRHLQQNPKDSSLNDIHPYGSNLIDFTLDWKVALFFANSKRNSNDEGALFVVRRTAMGEILHRGNVPFQDTIQSLTDHLLKDPDKLYGNLPLWIEPDFQLNNLLDLKPNRQKAIYLAQMDLRIDLGHSWELLSEETSMQVFVKLILPKGTFNDVQNFLKREGISQEYLFPKTIFDKSV